MIILTIILCSLCFGTGFLLGYRAYYLYANHMYMKEPEFFMHVLEEKIEKKRKSKEVSK